MPNAWPINMGPCIVSYKGVTIDRTFGDTKLSIKMNTAPKRFEQTGAAAYDLVVTGYEVTGEIPLGACTLEDLATLFPGSTLGDGNKSADLTINDAAGTSLRALADELILKPSINDTAGPATTWRKIVKACIWPEADESFNSTGTQSVYMLKFTGFVTDDGALAVFGVNSSS